MLTNKPYRALSLIEVLVAVALSGLLLVILSQVLIPGFQIWKLTQAVSELEQNGMLAEIKMEAALLQTEAASISSVDQPNLQAISFLDTEGSETQTGYDSLTGRPLWRSMKVFKLQRNTGILSEMSWRGSPLSTSETFAFTPSQLTNVCNSQEGRRVAHKVTSLRIIPQTEGFWRVEIDLETDTPRGRHRVQRGFSVLPRIQGDLS